MTTTNYLIQTTTWPSGKLETPNGKGSRKTGPANYTTSNLALKSGEVPITIVSKMRLNWVDSVFDTLEQSIDIWCQEMSSNQHAQIWHVETREWQLNVAFRSASSGATAE